MAMHRQPFFLFWVSKSHQEYVRLSVLDAEQDILMIHLFERLKLRAMAPRNTQVREVPLHPGGRASRALFVGSQKKDPIAIAGRQLCQFGHQIGSRYTLLQLHSEQARSPHEWHTVSENNIAPAKRLTQLVIVD